MRKIVAAGLGLIAVAVIVTVVGMQTSSSVPVQPIMISDFVWRTGAFDTMMIGDFTFANTGATDVQSVTVRCGHGAGIEANTRTIHRLIKAGQTLRVADVNLGGVQPGVNSAACHVIGVGY